MIPVPKRDAAPGGLVVRTVNCDRAVLAGDVRVRRA